MPHRDRLTYGPRDHFKRGLLVEEDKFILEHFPMEIKCFYYESAFLHSSPSPLFPASLSSWYHPDSNSVISIWIKEKPYEQNKRGYCKAEMNGVFLCFLRALTWSLAPLCSGNSSGLICYFFPLYFSFPIPCSSVSSQHSPLLTFSQAVRSLSRLSAGPPGAGSLFEWWDDLPKAPVDPSAALSHDIHSVFI